MLIKFRNFKLRSRLYNWKFSQALEYLAGESEEVVGVVRALASRYGNLGCVNTDDPEEEITKDQEILIDFITWQLMGDPEKWPKIPESPGRMPKTTKEVLDEQYRSARERFAKKEE